MPLLSYISCTSHLRHKVRPLMAVCKSTQASGAASKCPYLKPPEELLDGFQVGGRCSVTHADLSSIALMIKWKNARCILCCYPFCRSRSLWHCLGTAKRRGSSAALPGCKWLHWHQRLCSTGLDRPLTIPLNQIRLPWQLARIAMPSSLHVIILAAFSLSALPCGVAYLSSCYGPCGVACLSSCHAGRHAGQDS